MPSQTSLRDRIGALRSRYKFISPSRFLYNDNKELRRRYKKIQVWFLITDTGLGASIHPPTFGRAKAYSVKQWEKAFTVPGIVGEVSVMGIYTGTILPAMNAKGGRDWKFSSVIAWTGIHEDRKDKSKNPSTSTGNKNVNPSSGKWRS